MKKYLKRVGCIALASVMIIGALAGCGQGKGNSGGTNNDNAANNENTADNGNGNEVSKGEKVTIELMTWHGPESATHFYDGYTQLAEDYMALHDNVEIKIRFEADGTYGNILETGFAGNTAPDIIQMKSGQRSTYKMNLLNLREELTKPSAYAQEYDTWADSFVGGLDAFPVEDGGEESNALLFIPNDGNPEVYTGLIYIFNKKLVKDAGLDPDNVPITWTDMFKWLEVLQQNEKVAPIAGDSDLGQKVSQIGSLFGEDYQDKFFDGDVNDPEFLDDLFWDKIYVLTCYDKGSAMPLDNLPYYPAMFGLMKQHLSYFQPSWQENSVETEMLTFANAKAAMMLTSFWDYDTLVASLSESKFPEGYGIFQVPYMGEDTLEYAAGEGWITKEEALAAAPYTVTRPRNGGGAGKHDYGFCVNKAVREDAAKYDAVMDFLKYVSSREAQDKYVEVGGSLSPVKDVKVLDSMKRFIVDEPEGGFASRTLGYYAIEWGTSDWPVILLKYLNGEMEMQEAVEAITSPEWAGDIPAPEALSEAVDSAKQALEAAPEEEKEAKERAVRYAQLRQELYETYYYNMTGDLTEKN